MDLSLDLVEEAGLAPASLAERALDCLPIPVVILDGHLRLCLANACARERLEPPDRNAPSFEEVLAGSGRLPGDARRDIVARCAAAMRAGQASDRHDAVIAVARGRGIAMAVRPLGNDRWLVTLEERQGRADSGAILDDTLRDKLTELGNRRYFETTVADALRGDDPESQPAVLIFDLDRFHDINDRLGRQGGDALLRAVAGRLRRATRDADQIARLDADCFAVMQQNGEGADNLGARLVDLLGKPYLVRGEVAHIGVSVGVARAAGSDIPAAVLIQQAQLARHEAKEAGGHTWRRHGQSMAERALTRLELEADLRRAIALGQLTLAYQPRVNLKTRAIVGFEALARWTHAKRGAVPPRLFIPVAEDIGLIGQLGDWALRTACRDAATWPEPLTVSVNVSARQIDNGQRFLSEVAAALRDSGLPARRLEVEVTEAALIRRPEEARAVLRDLHEMGVRIAMDNFGAGLSSLGQLRDYPFDAVKIEQTYIRTLDSSADASAVVRAIATLGRGLGLAVIAQGVETRNQARMVEADGCTGIQGFLIGRAVPAADVLPLLQCDVAALLGEGPAATG